jgi:hypothetical protein
VVYELTVEVLGVKIQVNTYVLDAGRDSSLVSSSGGIVLITSNNVFPSL